MHTRRKNSEQRFKSHISVTIIVRIYPVSTKVKNAIATVGARGPEITTNAIEYTMVHTTGLHYIHSRSDKKYNNFIQLVYGWYT